MSPLTASGFYRPSQQNLASPQGCPRSPPQVLLPSSSQRATIAGETGTSHPVKGEAGTREISALLRSSPALRSAHPSPALCQNCRSLCLLGHQRQLPSERSWQRLPPHCKVSPARRCPGSSARSTSRHIARPTEAESSEPLFATAGRERTQERSGEERRRQMERDRGEGRGGEGRLKICQRFDSERKACEGKCKSRCPACVSPWQRQLCGCCARQGGRCLFFSSG